MQHIKDRIPAIGVVLKLLHVYDQVVAATGLDLIPTLPLRLPLLHCIIQSCRSELAAALQRAFDAGEFNDDFGEDVLVAGNLSLIKKTAPAHLASAIWLVGLQHEVYNRFGFKVSSGARQFTPVVHPQPVVDGRSLTPPARINIMTSSASICGGQPLVGGTFVVTTAAQPLVVLATSLFPPTTRFLLKIPEYRACLKAGATEIVTRIMAFDTDDEVVPTVHTSTVEPAEPDSDDDMLQYGDAVVNGDGVPVVGSPEAAPSVAGGTISAVGSPALSISGGTTMLMEQMKTYR